MLTIMHVIAFDFSKHLFLRHFLRILSVYVQMYKKIKSLDLTLCFTWLVTTIYKILGYNKI